MKKLQVAFAALMLAGTISFAQPATKQDTEKPGKHQHQNKMRELNLTDDQKAQMKAANEDFKAQMKAVQSDENQTVAQQRNKRAALAQAHKVKMESLLTPAQKNKMAELKATAKQQHNEISSKHFETMQKELNLTSEQASQLKNINDAMKSKLESIKNNPNLDEAAKRQQLTALKAERKATMDKVLTAEQKEKWQGMRKQHKGNRKMNRGRKNKIPANV